MQFRNDINGLRAISVLPVIFFHAGLRGFTGGYLGVDVFFVISGFLITSNIIKNLQNNKFSLVGFYDKRARRILPPLILTLLLTSVFSFIFMLPYDLKNYGQSLVATSLGANNILLYLTSGYWSVAAEFKPLYHTWSLGIEEQYYFIIPIIFIFLFKKQKTLLLSILTFFLISFISSLCIENREFNFLILLTRFWELCAGSLLAIYMKDNETKKSNILSFLGLLLIFWSYSNPAFFSSNQAIINIAPVLGAVLIIAFTKPDTFIYKALSQKIIMIIGFSSYSIYLFHQPILSFLRLASESEVDIYSKLIFSLSSIPLGYLSWKFIESPFRNKNVISNKVFYSLIAFFISSFITLGLFLHKSYGMHNYSIFSKYSYGVNPQTYADRAYSLAKDDFTTNKKRILIVGSSFARDFYNALEEHNALKEYEVVYLFDFFKNKDLSRKLLSTADLTFFVSAAGLANIFDANHIKSAAMDIKKEINEFSKGDYFYIGTKNFGFNNNFVRHIDWDSSKDYMVDINKSNIQADKIERKIFGDKYISLLDLFRKDDKIRIFTDKHRFISFDTDHVTKDGAVFLGEKLLTSTILQKVLMQ